MAQIVVVTKPGPLQRQNLGGAAHSGAEHLCKGRNGI